MPRIIRATIAALGLAVTFAVAACTGATPASTPAPAAQPAAATAPAPETKPAPSATLSSDVAKGQAVFQANCAPCHGKNAEGITGPDLRQIGAKRDRDFLTRWITDPAAVKPGTRMPKLGLSDSDLKAVVDYLLTLK